MAYRDFINETPYESPVIGDLPRTLQALQFTQQQKQLRQQQRQSHFDKYEQLIGTGKNPYYVGAINTLAEDVTKSVHNDFYSGAQSITPETSRMKYDVAGLNKVAVANEEEVNKLHQQIMDTAGKDKYYDPTEDLKENAKLISGDDEPVTLDKFKDVLKQHQTNISNQRQSINSPDKVLQNFRAQDFAADFVQSYKDAKKTQESSFKGTSGAKTSTLQSGIFFDEKGKPGITDEVVSSFLKHPMNNAYYTELAMNDFAKDADSAIAANPNFGKDISDAPVKSKEWYHDVVSAFTQNPTLDPVNKQPLNERARELARDKIKSLEAITNKVDTDLSDTSPAREAGILSKDVSSNEVFNGNTDYSAVGRTISRTKPATSPYFKFSSRSPIRLDTQTGKISTDNMPREFILNTVEVVPVNASGIPIGIKAGTVEEMEKQINEMPLSAFGKGGITGTKMAMRGQSVDKSVIDEAYKKKEELESQHAQNPTDESISQKLSFLNEQLDKYNYGESVNYKFLEDLTGRKALHDELMPVDPEDVNSAFIKDQTGADVYSQKFQSPAMLRVKAAIDRRVAEANANPVKQAPVIGPPRAKKATPTQIEPAKVTTDADYDKLPSGTIFIAPDGSKRQKP